MKISEIIKEKYKLRIPPTVYYELLADVVEAEEDQEPCNTDTCKVVKAYMNEWDKTNNSDAISRQAVLEQTYLWSKDEFLRITNPFT